ncbi:hypothetical protein [Paraburkholderia sp. GAS334]|uniref:hypothetical protein n=1 Tax=Paraburkholderia sp. GAS334 TaxID=3035131 RepID=UPI003D1D8EB1
MKTAAQLLHEFPPLVRNPKEAAALFAEDGVFELPYLADLGMRWQYKWRTEIASRYALPLQVVPGGSFETSWCSSTPRSTHLPNTRWRHSPSRRSGRSGSIFFGYFHVENGQIKLLREALNIVATARAFFPNGLADVPQPEAV